MGRIRSKLVALREQRRADAGARRNRTRGTHCFYCGVELEDSGSRQRTVDHRLPRSQAGADRLINLVFACRACNQRKADSPEDEFVSSAWLLDRRRSAGRRP